MRGPWLWAASDLRRRWRGALVLALLVGLGAGAVLAAVAGARRTETAFERFREVSLAFDAQLQVGAEDPGTTDEALRRVRALPEVAAVEGFDLYIGDLTSSAYDVGIIAGPVPFQEITRPRMVEGRLPDPAAPDELVTNEATADAAGLEVGDVFTVATFTPDQLASIEEEFTGFGGPEIELRLVGIGRTPEDLTQESSGGFIGTPAFHDRYLGEVGSYGGLAGLRLREGVDPVAGLDAVRAEASAVAGVEELTVDAARESTSRVTAATDVLASGLLAFAVAAGLATTVAVGQALSRRLSASAPDQATLDALGCTRRQRVAAAALTSVPVALGGAAVAVLTAVVASPLLPIGLARQAEPDLGVDLDGVVLGAGALAVVVLVVALSAAAAVRVSALRRWDGVVADGRARRSRAVALSARAGAPAPTVIGVGMALEPGRGRSAVPVRPALVGAVLGSAGIVAALTFGASLDRLVGEPAAYGWSFDLAPDVYDDELDVLLEGDDVASVGLVDLASVEVGGRAVQGMAVEARKGDPALRVLAGRAPTAAAEVALGSADLAALDLAIGDEVSFTDADGGSVAATIVGEVLFPLLDGNAFDSGALVPPDLLDEVRRSGGFTQVILQWEEGVDHAAAEARLVEQLPGALPIYAYPQRPGSVANLAGIASLPQVLAGFLVVVALAAIGHALVAGVLRRRRDLAVVRVLGFVRRQVATTITWQSLTLAAIGLVVGIPVGIAAGRLVWSAVATGIGVPPGTVVPVGLVGALVPLTLAAGTAFALLPARAAVRHRPADSLRAE